MGQVSMLQIGVQWDVAAAELEKLRQKLVENSPELSSDAIRLAPASLSVDGVDLTLADHEGTPSVLGTVRSSGYRPFSAIFSVPLSAEQNASVASALDGRAGILAVTYRASASVELWARERMTGDLVRAVEQLHLGRGSGMAPELIDQELREGKLTIVRSGNASPDSDLWRQADGELRNNAEETLRRAAASTVPFNRSTLELEVTRSGPLVVPLMRSSDVAVWFPGGAGEHLQVIGGSR
jgi:hypothetical protein